MRRRTFSMFASNASSRWSSSSVSSCVASLTGAIRGRFSLNWSAAARLFRVRGLAALALCALLVTSCAQVAECFRPPPTEVPFCAPFERELGSVQLDFSVTGTAVVSAAEAEAAARTTTGGAGILCSVRLAKYDNLADHRPLVWVVHV